jgi:hypothetical protein
MPRKPVDLRSKLVSITHINFLQPMGDVAELIRHHDLYTDRRPGKPAPRLEVLK